MAERTPPHSQEAEQALLGACLLNGDTLTLSRIASAIPVAGVFYMPRHREIYDVIRVLFESKEPVDIITVALELERRDLLEKCGGRSYLAELASGAGVNTDQYLNAVLRKYHQRQLIETCVETISKAYADEDEPEIIADRTAADLMASAKTVERDPVRLISSYLPDLITRIDEVQSKTRKPGIMTGFAKLDQMTVGFQPGELTIIAGRPKNGKTALLNCIATNVAKAGLKVLLFSAEMGGEQFALRSLCAEAGLNSVDLGNGRVVEHDWDAISKTMAEMGAWKYYIDDRASIDITALCAEASRAHSQGACDIVFIDYLQLITSAKRFNSLREMVGHVTLALVGLAKDLNVPVVAASQLSRETEKRRDPRPKLSDLAESGHIERHADNVLGIFRPELYASKKDKDTGRHKGCAELIVLAQRNGPVGTIDLYFEDKYTRFMELQSTFNDAF